jgi:hypothetical protein
MAFELAIELGTSVLRLKPGASATLEVGITNTGALVQHYQVELLGLPGAGMTGPANEPLKLLPRESGRVPVTVTLPADSPVAAGQYRIGVLVRSPFAANVSRTAELLLDVGSVAGFALTAYPEVVEGRGSGDFTLTARNTGNTPAQLSFDIRDEQGVAKVRIQPEILPVPPLGHASAAVSVRLPGRLTGAEKQAQVKIAATDIRDPAHPVNTSVRMVIRPLLSQALVNVLVGLITVAAAAVAIAIVKPFGPSTPAGPAPTAPAPLPTVVETTSEGEDPPEPPAITIEPAQPVVGEKATFKAKASDDVTYDWNLVNPDGLGLLSGPANQDSFSFVLEQEGTHLVEVTIARKSDPASTATSPLLFEVGPKPPALVRVESARDLRQDTTDVQDLECPAGLVPIVGGVNDDSDLAGTPYLRASRPEGKEKWRISGRSQLARKATYLVTCIQPLPGLQIVRTPEPDRIAGLRMLSVTCPSGTVLLGGGISGGTNRDQIALVNELGPASTDNGASWRSWVSVFSTNDPTKATIYAACAPEPPGYSVRSQDATIGGGNQAVELTATCSAGDVLAGGVALKSTALSPMNGFPSTGSFLALRTSRPVGEPGSAGQGWTTRADTFSEFGEDVVTVVICATLG